jgi:hypothetical protein
MPEHNTQPLPVARLKVSRPSYSIALVLALALGGFALGGLTLYFARPWVAQLTTVIILNVLFWGAIVWAVWREINARMEANAIAIEAETNEDPEANNL